MSHMSTRGTDPSTDAPNVASAVPVRRGLRVVVQHHQRLFRDGISQLLTATGDIEVVATATTDGELLAACRRHHPDVVVMEADVVAWDAFRLAAMLRQRQPRLVAVGLTSPGTGADVSRARARGAGLTALVPRGAGMAGILDAVRRPPRTPPPGRWAPAAPSTTASALPNLTARELEVLCLVGAGMTSLGVSTRLQISRKTVENHKQRIFAKLGVQSQAHAVSVALRSGLLRAERLVDLAVGQ